MTEWVPGPALAAFHAGVTVVCELAAQFTDDGWAAPTPCPEWRGGGPARRPRGVAGGFYADPPGAPPRPAPPPRGPAPRPPRGAPHAPPAARPRGAGRSTGRRRPPPRGPRGGASPGSGTCLTTATGTSW